MAVRTPAEREVAVGIRVVHILEKRLGLSALRWLDDQLCPVPQIGYILSVRGNCRLKAGLSLIGEEFFLELRGVGEVLVVLV